MTDTDKQKELAEQVFAAHQQVMRTMNAHAQAQSEFRKAMQAFKEQYSPYKPGDRVKDCWGVDYELETYPEHRVNGDQITFSPYATGRRVLKSGALSKKSSLVVLPVPATTSAAP